VAGTGTALLAVGAGAETQAPASQTRSPLQSVSFVHCACDSDANNQHAAPANSPTNDLDVMTNDVSRETFWLQVLGRATEPTRTCAVDVRSVTPIRKARGLLKGSWCRIESAAERTS